jgi:hypothetical protein
MLYERAAMNVRYSSSGDNSADPCAVPLAGAHGELLTVSIIAEPRDLENLLDRLGQSQYPIDPQIYHDAQVNGRAVTLVEFPAYDGWLDEIEQLLDGREAVTIRRCLTHAASN